MLKDTVHRAALINLIPKLLRFMFPEILVVGGAVRDTLLGQTPKDIDFTGPYTAAAIILAFKELKSYRWSAHRLNATYDTTIIVCGDERYEYTPFRLDVQPDGRQTDSIPVDSIEEDLSRRDLTVNAMASNIDGDLIDVHGGYEDIQNKILKAVGDPLVRVREDYSRGLRLPYFADRLGFTIDPATTVMIHAVVGQLAYVGAGTPDTLKAELVVKIFNKVFDLGEGHGGVFLTLLLKHSAFAHSYAVIADSEQNMQEVDSFWYLFHKMNELRHNPKYHNDNPAVHTFRVVNDCATRAGKWAALFHDIGKAIEYQETEDDWETFTFHDRHSELVETIGERLRLPTDTIHKCMKVHENHMQVKQMEKKSKIRRMQVAMGKDLAVLEEVSRADAGPNKPFNEAPFVLIPEEITPVLMGKHLLARGIEPGVVLGNRLRYAFYHQIEYGITDLEELESIAYNVDVPLLETWIRQMLAFPVQMATLTQRG